MDDRSYDERIAQLEAEISSLREKLSVLVERYNWHTHEYDYSRESSAQCEFDASTQPPTAPDRVSP